MCVATPVLTTRLIETDICEKFLELCDGRFCESELENPSVTWDDWIFAESRRRFVE